MKVFWRLILIFMLLAAVPGNISKAAGKGPVFQDTAPPNVHTSTKGMARLSAPDTNSFPVVQFFLNLYDSKGQFLDGLRPADIQIKEDALEIKPDFVEKVPNSLQLIFVLNLSPDLAAQVSGLSQYQRVQNALLDWAKQQSGQGDSTVKDDYSLATPTGLLLIRAAVIDQFTKSVKEYQPDPAKAQPSLTSLAEALDLATDPLGGAQMERALLYITPPPSPNQKAALTDLTSRAQKIGVRVNVWLIGASATNGSNALQELAQSTGGQFAEIKDGPLPAIEPLFQPQRNTYRISYTSAIQKTGLHNLSVQIGQSGASTVSNTLNFNLDVQPPNPIFLSPPAVITRTYETPQGEGNQQEKAPQVLAPAEVPLQILIEFPDQHNRPIKTTRLYVDQKLVSENDTEPFDRFSWSIASLSTAGRHMLRVEVTDSLGLIGASSEIPVDIAIEQPVRTSTFDHISSRGVIAVTAVAIAGGALILILLLSNRRRLGRRARMGANEKKRLVDPVTQPVQIKSDSSKPRGKVSEPISRPTPQVAAWPAALTKSNGQNAPARLVALDENEQPITGGVIPLSRQEITFGSDPRRATQLLESPTVDGLHARVFRTSEGCFQLADQDSVAGTWINFSPVPSTGQPLEHGDLIHIGRMMFRFEMNDPNRGAPAEIKVIGLEK